MAGEGNRRREVSSADALVRASVSLGVRSQPRNPRTEQWSCLSSNHRLTGDREALILEQRARGATLALPCAALLSLLFRSPLLVSLNNSQGLLFPPKPFSPSHLSHPPWSSFFPWESFLKRSWAARGMGRGHWTTEGRWQCQTKGINTLIKWPRKTGAEDGSGGEGGGKR